MTRLLMLPLLLLGFAASAQTAPTTAPRLGLGKPTTIPLYIEALSMKPNPMYVVDGQIVDSSALSTISPDQIKSVSIIKPQAAAASFGPRVRNGTVMITNKPVKTGR
ncbi:hypothetical protein [Hymenobacter lapidiphilus]|uniref:TonB-dependent receptor plug domain-containing protein n=1 Tax=Hymenobacter lapidiphilus TaxID=2608003 RepID=A0A7Y7PR24_9BACT|nr:hypothetical protein [Hymenobacter lapidiphilus]NVO32433.1 hypothetical protein [Hymenobacter lapidiphilus]